MTIPTPLWVRTMTQSTSNRPEDGFAWADRPETSAAGHAGQAPSGGTQPMPASDHETARLSGAAFGASTPAAPASGTSTYGYGYGYGSPQGEGHSGLPPAPPGTQSPRRERRGPGWGGVAAMGVGAAVLSSLLTAGVINATGNGDLTPTPAASSSASSNSSSSKVPVSSGGTGSIAWGKVAAAVEPSVVAVKVTSQQESGEGSGVIYDKSGNVITNNHVVSLASSGGTVTVVLNDGRGYDATVVGTDPSTDLAVIKIKNPPSDLAPATLGDSSGVKVGDPVMAVGNPLGLSGTVTTGIVSATDRPTTTQASDNTSPVNPFQPQQQSDSEQVNTNAIQTDAAVNPGNSGGALVNTSGEVIGIPSSIASLADSSMSSSQSGSIGIGFAIPVNEVKSVVSYLVKGQTAQHSYLGVSTQDGTVTLDGAQRDAAILESIGGGTPAARAGLRAKDGVIAVDGTSVNSAASLIGSLRERTPGTTVTLTIVRDGKSLDAKVTLGTKPTSGS